MSFFKKSKKKIHTINWKITQRCLNLIFEASKSTYPNEFGGLLRIDEERKDVIDEIVILPGTISGESHAIFRMHMMPIDFSIIGTVHSHPSFNNKPSDADRELFGKKGRIHIIVASPYNMSSWKAYDYNGNEIKIEVI